VGERKKKKKNSYFNSKLFLRVWGGRKRAANTMTEWRRGLLLNSYSSRGVLNLTGREGNNIKRVAQVTRKGGGGRGFCVAKGRGGPFHERKRKGGIRALLT